MRACLCAPVTMFGGNRLTANGSIWRINVLSQSDMVLDLLPRKMHLPSLFKVLHMRANVWKSFHAREAFRQIYISFQSILMRNWLFANGVESSKTEISVSITENWSLSAVGIAISYSSVYISVIAEIRSAYMKLRKLMKAGRFFSF